MAGTRGDDERTCHHTDPAELERRWALLRAALEEAGADVLVVTGANGRTGVGGTFHWITGQSASGSYPQTVLFPRDGAMVVIRHGAFGEVRRLDPSAPDTFGMDEHRGTPTFPAVSHTLLYDADIAADVIRVRGWRRVAIAGMAQAYAGFVAALSRRLGAPVDLSEAVDTMKAHKSAVEVAMLRDAAALQDAICEAAKSFIRPGMRDFEVMAEAQRIADAGGSEGGVFLGSSFAPGEGGVPVRHRAHQGRRIREGDIVFLLAENAGPGGMYVHASRYFCLGRPPQELVDLTGAALEAQRFTLSLLVDGAAPAEVFATYNGYMAARGYGREARLHAHGQGYDLVERPLVRNDETLPIRTGLNIGVHPFIVTPTTFATLCDNFLLTAAGPERLHRFPQEIVVL